MSFRLLIFRKKKNLRELRYKTIRKEQSQVINSNNKNKVLMNRLSKTRDIIREKKKLKM